MKKMLTLLIIISISTLSKVYSMESSQKVNEIILEPVGKNHTFRLTGNLPLRSTNLIIPENTTIIINECFASIIIEDGEAITLKKNSLLYLENITITGLYNIYYANNSRIIPFEKNRHVIFFGENLQRLIERIETTEKYNFTNIEENDGLYSGL